MQNGWCRKKGLPLGVVGRAIIRKVHPGMVSALGNGGTSNCINSYREDRRIIVRVITRVRFDQHNTNSGQDSQERGAHRQERTRAGPPPKPTNHKPSQTSQTTSGPSPLLPSSLFPSLPPFPPPYTLTDLPLYTLFFQPPPLPFLSSPISHVNLHPFQSQWKVCSIYSPSLPVFSIPLWPPQRLGSLSPPQSWSGGPQRCAKLT